MQPTALSPTSCPSCGNANHTFEQACKWCGGALTAWQALHPEELKRYQCWKCGGLYTRVDNTPNRGSGCIVVALGVLLAPVLIGIVLIIYGFSMMGETQSYWQCRSCGLTLPA